MGWQMQRYIIIGGILAVTATARADDRDAFSAPPEAPNIMFLLDDSGSMQNLACEDFPQGCFNPPGSDSEMLLQSGPNSSQECHSPSVDLLGYNHLVTYPYPDTDFSKPGDSGYPSGTYLTNFVSADVYGRSGWSVDATSITAFCNASVTTSGVTTYNYPNCEQRSRCIYMLTNYGYFYENTPNCIGVGDPMGQCPSVALANSSLACVTTALSGSKVAVGASCPTAANCICGASACISGKCNECSVDADCNVSASHSESGTQSCDPDANGIKRCVNEVDPQETTGNMMNLYPPKLVSARAVMKSVVTDYGTENKIHERMGLMVYNGSGNGGILKSELGPTCTGNAACTSGSCDNNFETWRNGIKTTINGLSFSTATPLGEALDDIGCYYTDGFGPTCSVTTPSGTISGVNIPPVTTCVAAGAGDPPACALPATNIGGTCTSTGQCNCGICTKKSSGSTKYCQECSSASDCTGSNDVCSVLSDGIKHCVAGTGGSCTTSSSSSWNNLANGQPICDSCQQSFAVVVTDGVPNGDGPGTTPTNLNPAGTGSGHQPVTESYYPGGIDTNTEWTNMLNDDSQHYLFPVVGKALYGHDLNSSMAGTQNVVTYAISFGIYDATNHNACAGMLARGAMNGGGQCYLSKSAADLANQLSTILAQINGRVRSFTAPSIQSSRANGDNAAQLVTFRPDSGGPLWEGHMFGFTLWDDTLKGGPPPGITATSPNQIFVLDKNNQPVAFDNGGNLLSLPFWDAALCLAGDAANTLPAVAPQDPFNLDVSNCYTSGDETAANARKIYTHVTGSGSAVDAFTLANETALHTQLGLAASAGACTPLLTTTACIGQKVIGFFRGLDMLDRAGRGKVFPVLDRNLSNLGTSPGWWKLGDSFHSAPVAVSAPSEYANLSMFGGKSNTGAAGSYTQFAATNAARLRASIVGANDGMIHAFNAGTSTGAGTYDAGTGKELWAFVPPHHLSKMATMLACPADQLTPCTVAVNYNYFVDGSAQVRDAYVSTTQLATQSTLANTANSNFWKTISISGDRDGGTAFTALDVTDVTSPTFLWEFPSAAQLGAGANQRAEPAGLSWGDSFPNPAAIVPIQFLDASSNPYLRWVAILNGGFSRMQVAGRGVYMVDAYTGQLLWKYEYKAGAPDDHANMLYSFAAPPSAVSSPSTGATQYIVAVDTGGQVWKFNVSTPQQVPSGGLVDPTKWTGARIFATAATSTTTSPYGAVPNTGTTLDITHYPYRPMFQLAVGAWGDTGDLWVYVGTGDRDLLDNPSTPTPTGITLAPEVIKDVCGESPYNTNIYLNRMYGLDLTVLQGIQTLGHPTTENNLTNNTGATPGTLAVPTAKNPGGWFLELPAGTKVNNPADVFDRVTYFTTYAPSPICGGQTATSTATCTAITGTGTLYALDFQTGLPTLNLTNSDSGATFGKYAGGSGIGAGTISAADASLSLGSGVPSAPHVSYGQQGTVQSGAIIVSTSANSSPTTISAKTQSNIASTIYRVLIPRSLHDLLNKYGTSH